MSFKTWSEAKKVKESDLIFTRALKSPVHLDLFHKLADQVAGLNPSFSEGLQILELITDLILMGHQEELFAQALNVESYKSYLKSLRYPQTTQRDENLKSKLESLPWPYGAKVKFERRGDRAGVELKLFISSEIDLTKILASLERVKQDLSAKPETSL
jgi:hypothetical protein